METIYKYQFKVTDSFIIEMPQYAIILTVQTQRNQPCIWAKVNDENPLEKRYFCVFGTGHPFTLNKTYNYIGTFQLNEGAFIGHLFEDLMIKELNNENN